LAIVVVTPVVGVAAALLPFALVGMIAWGGYRGVHVLARRRAARRKGPLVAVEARIDRPRRQRLRHAGRVALEVLGGAVVGALVAGGLTWDSPAFVETMLAGVAAGAVVGYLVGGAPRVSETAVCPEYSGGRC
jgi:hypothetical protein